MESAESKLRKYLNKLLAEVNFQPRDVEVKAISSGGANYSSDIFKVTVSSNDKDTLHLFAKVPIFNQALREQYDCEDIFLHEHLVYEELRKSYDDLQKKHGIPENDRFQFAKYYGSNLEPGQEVFIFEDLNARGFQIYDRFEVLYWDHVSANIKVLANFHALSFVLEKENPKLWERFKAAIFPSEAITDMLKFDPEYALDGLSESHKNRMRTLIKEIGGLEAAKDFYKPFGRDVIIHSDFRPSNIMFKQEGEDITVIPVDYQTIRMGSIACDLLYYIATATNGEFRKQHYERLLNCYHDQLARRLRDCNISIDDVYPRCQLDSELKKMWPLILLFALCMFPILVVPPDAAPSFAEASTSVADLVLRPSPQSTARLAELIDDCTRYNVL